MIVWLTRDSQLRALPASDKMDSLKTVAAKVKHSPKVIRKTFANPQKSYNKVTEGERAKGRSEACVQLISRRSDLLGECRSVVAGNKQVFFPIA